MNLFRKLGAALLILAMGAAPAAAQDPVLNKEGFWSVGHNRSGGGCFASLPTKAGALLILRAEDGQVALLVGSKTPMTRGRKATLATEAYSFEFKPDFSDANDLLATEGALNDRALAALRLAQGVEVAVDGVTVISATLDGTGAEGALDAVIACSRGEQGWWGAGAGGGAKASVSAAMNPEKTWFLERSPLARICTAYALVTERTMLILIGAEGVVGLAVRSDDPLPRGRHGRMEADAHSFTFKPVYDGDSYFAFDPEFDRDALSALRGAKALRVSVDGRAVAEVVIDGTGLPAVLDDLAACSKGQRGWWGEGAKPR
ncbi:hypothetical protein [Phenylobacterium sp.]|uniref:hypothetical protein n=1 Tax=Phenylobacterium sp. TaxID=1871053 RepID=UPI0025DA507F|nr:hypothetical protein [Phenylobacterium sp.]